MTRQEAWKKKRTYNASQLGLARVALEDIRQGQELRAALRAHPLPDGAGFLAKHTLVAAYRQLVESGEWQEDPALLAKIRTSFENSLLISIFPFHALFSTMASKISSIMRFTSTVSLAAGTVRASSRKLRTKFSN